MVDSSLKLVPVLILQMSEQSSLHAHNVPLQQTINKKPKHDKSCPQALLVIIILEKADTRFHFAMRKNYSGCVV